MLKFGLIPEFVGRLPIIATLEDLDEKALITILTDPKNSLVKQYQALFAMENVELSFTDAALHYIAQQALKRKTGARGLRSILEACLLDLMYELPDYEGIEKISIDVQDVKDPNVARLLRGAQKKAAPSEKESA